MIAFLMIIAAEMLIDLLMEPRTTAVSAIAIGAVGWALFRRFWQPSVRSLSRGLGWYPTQGLLQPRQSD